MFCPRKILAVALAIWLASPGAAWPQQQRQPEDPRARIRTSVELVVVPVTAKDRAGKAVLDIRQNEFRVLEDGIEQEVSVFSVDPFPLSAVILLDNSLRDRTAQQVETSLPAIAGGLSENDEVSVCRFDVQVEPCGPFASENDRVLTQLKRLELDKTFPGQASGPMSAGPRINGGAGSPGTISPRARVSLKSRSNKNIDDAIYAAGLLLKERERERRKIIFLVSDGHNSRSNDNSFQETLKLLLSADISVYAIGVGDADMSLGTNVLAKYAHATGGDVFYANGRQELESMYSAVTEQARNQYTLAYVPQKTDRSLSYHAIEVRVRRPGLTLLARDGYYVAVKQ